MLTTELAGIRLKNPVILAAGILGTNASILKRVASIGAGAVTTKSIGPKPRDGHINPTILCWEGGIMNAIGLSSPGYKNMQAEFEELKTFEPPVIYSIYGESIDEFVEVTEGIVPYKPAMIEVNLGCPNTDSHGRIFGTDAELAGKLVNKVVEKAGKIPVMPKLTPNTDYIIDIAMACEDAGAKAIAGFNTWGSGMVIDINTRRPILTFKRGGVSGPAVRPMMIKGIYDIYEKVDVPLVAIGGITYGHDAIEAIVAGATAVEIGSAVYYKGIDVFKKVTDEMESWMRNNGVRSLKELIGSAH